MKIRVTQEQFDAIVGMYEIIPTPPPSPKNSISQMVDNSELKPETKEAVKTWVKFRRDDGAKFNSTAVNSLIICAEKNEVDYGSEAVCNLIHECIAANYKSIYWDRLGKLPKKMGAQRKLRSTDADIEYLKQVYERVKNESEEENQSEAQALH